MKSFWKNNLTIKKSDEKVFDIVIVGAGITGLSLAYWLKDKGLKVAILDRGKIGSGASGRNGGFLTGGSISYFAHLVDLYGKKEALKIWKYVTDNINLIKEEIGLNACEFKKCGTTSLFKEGSGMERKVKEAYKILENDGHKLSKTNEMGMVGYNIENDATVNPMMMLEEIIKKLERNESKYHFYEDFTVTSLVEKEGKYIVRETDKNIIADKVIIATNSNLNKFISSEFIEPKRSQICYIKCDTQDLKHSNYLIPSKRIYFRKQDEGIVIGGLRSIGGERENTHNLEVNPLIINALVNEAKKMFDDCELVYSWAGIMGFTHDEQPVYRQESENLYYIGGFSGHGNGYAFSKARDLVNTIFSE